MTTAAPTDLSRLSLNQYTTNRWTVREAVEGCARAGIPAIGLWRDKVAETGLAHSARLVRDAGITVSSLCRGGMFPALTQAERQIRIDDNRRAIDEAAELGTATLVLVCGGQPDRDLDAARAHVMDGIAAVIPYAAERGVKLGIEPLHPMFCADRSVVATLGQANNMARVLNAQFPDLDNPVGVIIDVYHVWWDPAIYAEIESAAGLIFGFHISDWIVPLPDVLKGRGMMGDGCIEIRRLREAVDRVGYSGSIEVEIFNDALWGMPGDDLLRLMCARYIQHG